MGNVTLLFPSAVTRHINILSSTQPAPSLAFRKNRTSYLFQNTTEQNRGSELSTAFFPLTVPHTCPPFSLLFFQSQRYLFWSRPLVLPNLPASVTSSSSYPEARWHKEWNSGFGAISQIRIRFSTFWVCDCGRVFNVHVPQFYHL
jgi:hypothetical protein